MYLFANQGFDNLIMIYYIHQYTSWRLLITFPAKQVKKYRIIHYTLPQQQLNIYWHPCMLPMKIFAAVPDDRENIYNPIYIIFPDVLLVSETNLRFTIYYWNITCVLQLEINDVCYKEYQRIQGNSKTILNSSRQLIFQTMFESLANIKNSLFIYIYIYIYI